MREGGKERAVPYGNEGERGDWF